MKIYHSATVHTGTPHPTIIFKSDFGALYVEFGKSRVNGKWLGAGSGALLKRGDLIELDQHPEARVILFELSKGPESANSQISTKQYGQTVTSSNPLLLRLDQVDFPPGATAYRHVHAGTGNRVLIAGELEVISDDHTEIAQPGHIWFEPENSPVRAEASKSAPLTSFVRFMVLPVAYAGKPSIRILDAEDALKPRLQATKRHFEKIVQLEDG